MGTQNPVLFVGPTLWGLETSLLGTTPIDLRPPVGRGDIQALIHESHQPGVIVIADGIFYHYPAVGHAEIRGALNCGWSVWGVSSMGAIRAAEMQALGVRGFGEVYQMFVDDPDFTDDEVALLHQRDVPYRPLSEPLVHIRRFLENLTAQWLIEDRTRQNIINDLKSLWFGDRTLRHLGSLQAHHTGIDPGRIARELQGFEQYRVKSHDLRAILESRPWEGG
jgi:hypothetical protein